MAANVHPRVEQTDGQTKKFNTVSLWRNKKSHNCAIVKVQSTESKIRFDAY